MNGVLGIDPGKSGGMAIVGNKRIATPFELDVNDNINCKWMFAWLTEHYGMFDTVYVEFVTAIQGAEAWSTLRRGVNLGQIQGVLQLIGIIPIIVTAQVWTKFYGFEKLPKEASMKDKKARNIAAFNKEFPSWDLRPTQRSTTPHLGMLDAALIANYGYQKTKGTLL